MRQTHLGGDKLFVDYAGDTVPVIIDQRLGKVRRAHLFVAVSGRPRHQNSPQGLVARPRDDAEPDLAGGRMIFRRQAHPSGKMSARFEHPRRRRLHDQ
jgi:transposase